MKFDLNAPKQPIKVGKLNVINNQLLIKTQIKVFAELNNL